MGDVIKQLIGVLQSAPTANSDMLPLSLKKQPDILPGVLSSPVTLNQNIAKQGDAFRMRELMRGYDYSKDYDYAAAAAAGVPFDPANGQHGDSRFKMDWHQRRFLPSPVGIFDTKYSKIMSPDEFQAQATPIQKNFVSTTDESIPADEAARILEWAKNNQK